MMKKNSLLKSISDDAEQLLGFKKSPTRKKSKFKYASISEQLMKGNPEERAEAYRKLERRGRL